MKKLVRALTADERRGIKEELAQTSQLSFDFLLLVVLSCAIATSGLLTNSVAVIIGAMLVAPLMSPIIGLGLASVTGDSKLCALLPALYYLAPCWQYCCHLSWR